jgi:hypothetical protein
MKYFFKSFAVFIAWAYLLTCLAPYSPCYAMDTSDQETSAFVGKKPSSKKAASSQEEISPQSTSWFSSLKRGAKTVWTMVQTVRDVSVLFVATLISPAKTTEGAKQFYKKKGEDVVESIKTQIKQIRTDGPLTYTANKGKSLVKGIVRNPLDTVTFVGGALLVWTGAEEAFPLLRPCVTTVSNFKLGKGLTNLASSMSVKTRSGKLAKFAVYSTAIFCIASVPVTGALEFSSYTQARSHYSGGPCPSNPWEAVMTPASSCLRTGKSLEECRALIPTGRTTGDDLYIFTRHSTTDASLDPVSVVKLYGGKTCFYTALTSGSPVTETCFPSMSDLATRIVKAVPELTLTKAHEGLSPGQSVRHIGLHLRGLGGSCGTFHEMTTGYDLGEEPICLLTALRSGGDVTQMCFNPRQPESLTLRRNEDASLTFDDSDGRPFSLVIRDPKKQGLNVLPDVNPESTQTQEQGFQLNAKSETTEKCNNPPLKDLSLEEVIKLWKKERGEVVKDEL